VAFLSIQIFNGSLECPEALLQEQLKWEPEENLPHTQSNAMNLLKPLVIFTFVLMIHSNSFAQSDPNEMPTTSPANVSMSAEKLEKVDDAMHELVSKNRIAGGVVMIARQGRVVHFKAYGKRDIENNLPMKTDTIFRAFSMTKSIVTAAALMLQDEGKLNVNDPVWKYIPELKQIHVLGKDVTAGKEMKGLTKLSKKLSH